MNLTQRLLLALLVLVALTTAAWAENKTGMYWGSSTEADGIRVRRLDDATQNAVCWVATYTGGTPTAPAISCIWGRQ